MLIDRYVLMINTWDIRRDTGLPLGLSDCLVFLLVTEIRLLSANLAADWQEK